MKIRVYYEDTDAGGIVYHANYLKFCERARSEIFFQQEMIPAQGEHTGFVVRNIKAAFLATSKLGNMLHVTTKLLTKRNASLVLLQEIWREETKVFSMEVTLVYIDQGNPCRIPDAFQSIFDSF